MDHVTRRNVAPSADPKNNQFTKKDLGSVLNNSEKVMFIFFCKLPDTTNDCTFWICVNFAFVLSIGSVVVQFFQGQRNSGWSVSEKRCVFISGSWDREFAS